MKFREDKLKSSEKHLPCSNNSKYMNIKHILFGMSIVGMVSCANDAKKTEDEHHEDGHEHMMVDSATADPVSGAEITSDMGVDFENLKDKQEITSPYTVKMMVKGMEVEPAGELHVNKGHHHILIDSDPLERGIVVPMDSLNLHFGKGQTETSLALSKGIHKLTLQFADGAHRSYGPAMSQTITIKVK